MEKETRSDDAEVEAHKKHLAADESTDRNDPEKKAENDEPDVEGHKMYTKKTI